MDYMLYDQNHERKKNYEEAKKDLFQAINSIAKLDDFQKRQLFSEFANAGLLLNMYTMLQQRFD